MSTALAVIQTEGFISPQVCAECGGMCCKSLPGITSPEDWGAPDKDQMQTRLTEALGSGRYSIDWWDGDPRKGKHRIRISKGYFVRPATKRNSGGIYDPSWVGECVFLADDGCTLEHEQRPLECRYLEPKLPAIREKSGCDSHGIGKQSMAIAWIPYRKVLKMAAAEAEAVRMAA